MTNLSELLPSGGGAKEFSAVASGTLANGQTVVLKADGKVEAVGILSEAIGATNQWATSNNTSPSAGAYGSVYDPDSQRVVVAYYDGNNNYYGYCVAGEVDPSNNTITFGTQVLFQSNFIIPHSIGYDTTNDKIVVFFQNVNSSSHGQAKVGTFTGSTLSFPGSQATFNAGSTEDITAVFNPDQGTFLVIYKDNPNSGRPTGVVGTVSGTSISFGSETQLDSNGTSYQALTYNTTANSYVMVYNKSSVTQQVYYQMPTTSGTTVTAGTPTLMTLNGSTTAQVKYTNLSSDNASNTVFLTFANEYDSNHAHAIAATISGSTLTFGTEVEFSANTTYGIGAVYDTDAQKLVVSYADTNQYGIVVVASVSGTTLTFGSPTTFRNASTNSFTNAYDSVNKKVVVTYYEQNTGYSGSVVVQPESSNASNFIGITSEAIANTATGKVNPQGGVATSSAVTSTSSVGTENVYETAFAYYNISTFDSTNNRVVIAYADQGNGMYGTAVVGTINGSTISFGTPQAFTTASIANVVYNPAITFDSNVGKVILGYSDGANNNYWTCRVATVDPSNNTLTFGTAAVVEPATPSGQMSLGFDTNSNKFLVIYGDGNNSNYITGRVGTISGTNITFGTKNAVINGSGSYNSVAFDSNVNKFAVFYRNPNSPFDGKCKVATISGTNVTYGSEATYSSTVSPYPRSTFDSNSNKIVVAFEDQGNNSYVTAAVGTISGTNITFGSTSVIYNGVVQNSWQHSIVFDSTTNKIVHFSRNGIGGDVGTINVGTVSGTGISFVADGGFNNNVEVNSVTASYDPTSQTIALAYADAGNSNYGTGVVYTPTGISQPFVIGSTYYVQNGGTLNTTSSSVTAGKAISTTQLILNGAS